MHTSASRNTTQIIIREHQQLSMVIDGMLRFVRLLEAGERTPGATVFRAMLFYIREYPEEVHHPKEDHYLFARLQERTDTLDDIIEELKSQHAEGEKRVRNLEHALTRFELAGPSELTLLREKVEEYASFYRKHRQLEEEQILPAAMVFLTAQDWLELDAVFGANRDPFEGVKLEEDLDKLYAMIAKTIPEEKD